MSGGLAVLALRLAVRELRGGLKGFYVFLACLALGVAAIAGVGSLSHALRAGLAERGQEILGGDVALRSVHRRAGAAERAFLAARGAVSEVATLRAMARTRAPADQTLVELKAVDDAYPLYGSLALDGDLDLAAALAPQDGLFGAVAEPVLLARLGIGVGDTVEVGEVRLRIAAVIAGEPDRLSAGLAFGPRLLVGLDALAASGLVRPGSLMQWHYRVRLPEGARGDRDLAAFRAAAAGDMPQAGWEVRDRTNAAPGLQNAIDRFAQILALVGLTALFVGGVGVANAVRGHLDAKRTTIAVLKCLGAPARGVFLVYLFEIGLIALAGIAAGLVVGAVLPLVAAPLLAGVLPLPPGGGLHALPLVQAALYGLLIALAFALWPLGVARDVPAAALFRDHLAVTRPRPRAVYVVATALAGAALVALAVASASETRIAWVYIAVAAGTILVLRAVAAALTAAARRARRAGRADLRLALGNIHRPGALTPSIVLSLGLGLTLLVTLALVDRNLARELTASMPQTAPSFFFVDIGRDEADEFAAFLADAAPQGAVAQVPMLRGRIVALDGVPIEKIAPPPQARWVLEGDRGVTYSATLPEGSRLVEGRWWPAERTGGPLVSFEVGVARLLGLGVGSTVTVNVLGRTITATIASLRTVDWDSLAINFVMVFSPDAFAGAPHMMLATLTMPATTDSAEEAALMAAVTRAFPHVTTVRVKEALEAAAGVVRQILLAIRAASGVTIAASLLVLAGALAAGHRARLRDAAILKIVGATRGRLVRAYALEFLILALATAVFAVLAGTVAAWIVLAFVMHAGFVFVPGVAAATAAGAALLLVALGLAANWRLLGQKPAPALRHL